MRFRAWEIIFGSRKRTDCQDRYRIFISEVLDLNDVNQLAVLMGSPAFEASIRSYVGRSMYRIALPKSYRSLARPTLAELFRANDYRRKDRDAAIRRAHVIHAYELSEIATYLNLHPNTISKVLRRLRLLRSGDGGTNAE